MFRALAARVDTSELVQLLAPHFTVYTYDRRGRGDSGDTKPYAVKREVEDLAAVIDAAGGSAYVYGKSSGASLALEATSSLGGKVTKLALYEAPYIPTRRPSLGLGQRAADLVDVLGARPGCWRCSWPTLVAEAHPGLQPYARAPSRPRPSASCRTA